MSTTTADASFSRPQRKEVMPAMTTTTAKPRSREEGEFRLIFLASFALFLFAALISRAMPWNWGKPRPGQPRSIIAEARAAANTAIPFAFMA